jgi:D-aspartate ligase
MPMASGLAATADFSTPAVVLKFDQNVMHHGGLGAIRSLGRLGVPVYGVHEGPLAPAASSRYLRGRWFWQPDAEQPERAVAGLCTLAERIGRPAVLIPTDDAAAIFLAEHGAGLREAFLFPAPPPGLPRRVAGKFSLHEVCREHGMPVPLTALPGSAAEAAAFAAGTGYPVIAKLVLPWRVAGGGLRSTTVLRSSAGLASLWQACEQAGAGVMLQEYLPAGPDGDWFFHGYCDATAACRPGFTGVKIRSYPAHAGLTSLGRAEPSPGLAGQLTALLARVGYQGIVDLDLRRDARDGQYKLLDFNPRLGAQFRLLVDSAGVDVVRAAYLDLTGQDIPAGRPLAGRRFLVENYDPISAIGYWRCGELGPRSWLSSLRGVDEAAWFARDDLRPFGLMCVRMGARATAARLARRSSAGSDPSYRPGRAAGRPVAPARRQPALAGAPDQASPARRQAPRPPAKGDSQ